MFRGTRGDSSVFRLLVVTIAILLSVSFATEAKTKKKKKLPGGTPVMWSAPEESARATFTWDRAERP